MQEIIATVSSKGRVVIPIEVREHFGIEQGSKVVFFLEEDGRVELKVMQYSTVATLRGAAGKLAHPRSWEEMRHIAREDHLKEIYSPE